MHHDAATRFAGPIETETPRPELNPRHGGKGSFKWPVEPISREMACKRLAEFAQFSKVI